MMQLNKLNILIFISRRHINTKHLKDTLDLLSKKESKNKSLDQEIQEFSSTLEIKINNFKENSMNYKVYEDIESNLKESERILNEGANLLNLSKEKMGELSVNVLNNQLKGDKNDILNTNTVENIKQDIEVLSGQVLNNTNIIDKSIENFQSNK